MKTDKSIMKRTMFVNVLFALVLLMTNAQLVQAQDVADAEAVIAEAVDTVAAQGVVGEVDSVPEWYVAPVIAEKHRAPHRAKAKSCPVDSVCTYDVNEQLSLVSAYDYDEKDSVIRETKWAYTDGVRYGVSKQEFGYDAAGRQNMSAIYEWVSAEGKWRGTEKAEYVYETYAVDEEEQVRIISETIFAWVKDDWVADKKYTHVFDEKNRDKEFTTYARNAKDQLALSKRQVQEWDAEDRLVLDIRYEAHDGTDWSKGTKKIWAFDANGNQTEYTYYSSIANHSWVGSSRELWTYDGATKTKYEKYAWSNGWVGSTKEEWGYTGGKQTMYAKYSWSNGKWVGVSKEEWNYVSGKQTLYAKYTWQNDAWVGVSKEEWEYTSAGKDKRHEKFSWNGAWQTTEREDWTYNTKGKETLYVKNSL